MKGGVYRMLTKDRYLLPEKAVPVLEHGGPKGTHGLV